MLDLLLFVSHTKKHGLDILLFIRYYELLNENFDNVYLEDAKGHESRLGEEKMSVWKRKQQ